MRQEELKMDLQRIVFIGRTFAEYMQMFNLTEEELIGRQILDCPAGACSFTSIANQLGADVTATDMAYFHPIDQLEEKGLQDIEHILQHLEKVQGNYVWNYFKSVEELIRSRVQALSDFLRDIKQTPASYVPSVLPVLPFSDNAFDLTLSAHFLFMYADRLDYNFHLQTVQELMGVTKDEIRIFPMVDLSSKRYPHLDKLLLYIYEQGWEIKEIPVSYEFQRKANSMLKIKVRNI